MWKNLLKSLRITLVFCVFFAVFYVFILWIFGVIVTPNHDGQVETLTLNGQVVGAEHIGQNFTQDIYFWGRPSASNYTADASGGSNKAPDNKEYLQEVDARVDSFLVHHPYLTREQVPAEMVTASGSGLDPDISPESAYAQVQRVAEARQLPVDSVKSIVDATIESPFLGIFGTSTVNVLRLNIALEEAYGSRN